MSATKAMQKWAKKSSTTLEQLREKRDALTAAIEQEKNIMVRSSLLKQRSIVEYEQAKRAGL